jgi:hypothetical protein
VTSKSDRRAQARRVGKGAKRRAHQFTLLLVMVGTLSLCPPCEVTTLACANIGRQRHCVLRIPE